MPSFRVWLQGQTERQDPVGDLARDVEHDRCWRGRTWRSLDWHIVCEHQTAIEAAIRALALASVEYSVFTS